MIHPMQHNLYLYIYSNNYIIHVTLITESDTVFLYPLYAKIAKSEVLNFGVPS